MGVLQFYGRICLQNGTWIDAAPKVYGFSICNYPSWGRSESIVYGISDSYLLYPENNILAAMRKNYKDSGSDIRYTGQRVCLTNDTQNNYIEFIVQGPNMYSGNMRVNGTSYYSFMSGYNVGYTAYAVFSEIPTAESPADTIFHGSFAAQTSTNSTYNLYTRGTLGQSTKNALLTLVGKAPGPKPDPDPYEGGGTSVIGGGTGDFDTSSESINIPGLPATTAVSTGFLTLFNPSTTDLRDLASYMWANPLFDLNAWRKIFADPMGAILGLSIVPVAVPTSGTAQVTVGNIPTGISMPLVSNQYVVVNCGSIQVKEFWGGYLDYSPYTKAEIYLPYCGIHAIDIDDIMGKTVNVVYHIDILSGACCVYVKCDTAVLYTFIGQCSSSIPITGDNWTNVINGVLSAAVSVGSMVATGGSTAPMAIPQLASTVTNSLKPSIEKSGAMGGTGGLLAYQYPYLIITRPRQALPEDQNKFMGYPSFVTVELSTLRGYTEVEHVHLENIGATDSELKEIVTLLKNGVIF